MADYNLGYYIYFKNMTYNSNIYNIGFILNQRHNMCITSLLNIMEEKVVFLAKHIC